MVIPILMSACAASHTSTTSLATFSRYQLEYVLLSQYPGVFWCDPDVYPVARPGQEQQNATQQFPTIQANGPEFSAILQHLLLQSKPSYTDEEKLLVYRQYKLLTYAVQMTPSGAGFAFALRVGEGQGRRIEGTITAAGHVTVTGDEPSVNTCPICLAEGTIIDTPVGPIAVQDLKTGTLVWTLDSGGHRVAQPVLETETTAVPDSFLIVRLVLADGRSLEASPGHPTPDGRPVGELRPGDTLDGSTIISAQLVNYQGRTYDILPAGGTGLYWANGILLKSTMAR